MWEAELARVSVFAPDTKALALDTWEKTIGSPATQTVDRPADRVSQSSGVYKNYNVQLNAAPGRADVIMTANIAAAGAQLSAASLMIGDPTIAISDALDITRKWMRARTGIQRLAIGLSVSVEAENGKTATKLIADRIPTIGDFANGGEDLAVQINRIVNSKVDPEVRINRLRAWSAAQVGLIQIGIVPIGAPAVPVGLTFRAQLTIDVNTAQNSVINVEQVDALLDEMVEMALEIAENGDAP